MGTEASDLSMDAASKKMPSEADAQTKTVKFNVGGRHFEVSRSLFDQHGDTVLGKLISDTWQSDPKKSIFIDRSGDIFAWVLEYLRYGSIELPTSIPRSMFGREMDYYSIVSEDESVVQHETILEATKSIKNELSLTEKKCNSAKMRHDMFAIANYAHFLFATGRTQLQLNNETRDILRPHFRRIDLSFNELKQANDYLESFYGLCLKKASCCCFIIAEKSKKKVSNLI